MSSSRPGNDKLSCSLAQSQHFDVANTCGGSLEQDSAKARQNCWSESTPHDAANVWHRLMDLGFMRNALKTSLLRLMVQNATSAIVTTGNGCVCLPVTTMLNIPRATFDFARKASLSKPRSRSLTNASAALRVANFREAESPPCFRSLIRVSGALLRGKQADRPSRTAWRYMCSAIWLRLQRGRGRVWHHVTRTAHNL